MARTTTIASLETNQWLLYILGGQFSLTLQVDTVIGQQLHSADIILKLRGPLLHDNPTLGCVWKPLTKRERHLISDGASSDEMCG